MAACQGFVTMAFTLMKLKGFQVVPRVKCY